MSRGRALQWGGVAWCLVQAVVPTAAALEAVTNPTTDPLRGRTRMYPVCPASGGYLTVTPAGQLECKAIPVCPPGYALTFDGVKMKCTITRSGGGGWVIR